MKKSHLAVLGLAGVAVYMIVQSRGAKNPFSSLTSRASEVLDQGGKAFANGWRYFSDGTSIDPSGNYYKESQLVWSPTDRFQ